MTEVDCMATAALELTSAAVFNEETLSQYVLMRTEELTRDELVELVTMLAAVSGATYEAWADETDRPVTEMLAAAGSHFALNRVPETDG